MICAQRPVRRREGMAMAWAIIAMVALLGISSLAVDYGRVQVVKTELQRTADAAARYAVTGLVADVPDVITETQNRAIDAADDNKADEQALVLERNADIVFGTWDNGARTFTPLHGIARANANAVRVTACRVASRGTAVPLTFARMVGQNTCDVHATAIAMVIGGASPPGLIGLDRITVRNNFVASYNSDTMPNPSTSNYCRYGSIASNGVITAQNNEEVHGDVYLGPSGSTNMTTPRPPIRLPEDLPAPVIDPGNAASQPNPGGVGQAFTVSGRRTLPGGTYYFTSITINNNGVLTFSDAATVYVQGDILFKQNGTISAYNNIPANLKLYLMGADFGGPNANNVTLTADVQAPSADFSAQNNATIYGRAVFRTITAKNNMEFYYDEVLGGGRSPLAITLVR